MSRWQMRIDASDASTVHGKANAKVNIGASAFSHHVLLADINENIILDTDIMNAPGERSLTGRVEEIILCQRKGRIYTNGHGRICDFHGEK